MHHPRFTIVKELVSVVPEPSVPKILIAEDDPALRRVMAEQLAGYELLEAANGEEALQLTRKHHPDVLVLDWMMPKLDGLEVCRALRIGAATKEILIILLTGRNDESSRVEGLEAGVNDFVSKPLSFVELKHRVHNMVEASKTQQELRNSRELLDRAQKFSALGELSAGIVHEINNPLNYASTGIHALKMMREDLDGEIVEEFDEIVGDVAEGLTRVSQIVRDLRTFAKRGQVEMKRMNLAKVVRMSERLVKDRLQGVQYEAEIPEDLHVHGSEGQLSQVLVNLLVNAVDALEDAPLGDRVKSIRVMAEERPQGVYLSVWDNGCGIPEDQCALLFDPFYSTKEAGKGMGMGLSVCHRILQTHGAELMVDSAEGHYTSFYTLLPTGDALEEEDALEATHEQQEQALLG